MNFTSLTPRDIVHSNVLSYPTFETITSMFALLRVSIIVTVSISSDPSATATKTFG
jgi:hypothetical protein